MPIQENAQQQAETKQTNKDRLKEITDSIEKGIKELFESDKYKKYLTTMSRFHHYSVNNQMLIYMQMPNATHVAGFNKWHDQFGRNVLKGQRGIKIISPTPFKKKVEKEKLDPDTKLPMLDADGKVITEEKEVSIPMFKPVTVFDISQTDGKPLPQLASDLHGNVQNFEIFMEALKRSAPVPITIEPMAANLDGFFNTESKDIHIREGMSEIQTVSAAVHEIAHSKLHDYKQNELLDSKTEYDELEICGKDALFSNGRIDRSKLPEGLYCYDIRGTDDDPGELHYLEERVVVNHAGSVITAEPITLPESGRIDIYDDMGFKDGSITVRQFYENAFPEKAKKSRNTEEVEAESISYAVCQYYGIETGENSFGYIATWSKDKDLKELRASLETINKTSSELITDIDRNYAEIIKERGITEEKNTPEQEPATAMERLFNVDDKQYLHVQRCDDGFDYSIYDIETQKLIDGGQHESDAELLSVVALDICKLHNIGLEKPLRLADISILDSLQNAEIMKLENRSETPEASIDEPMPDSLLDRRTMESFGYTDETMLPLSKDRALELMERDVTVYLLYGDNTEAMALDDREIIEHNGLFGITREDWDAVKADIPIRDVEKRFEQNPEDGILIYQFKDTAPAALHFASYDRLNEAPSAENYKAIYTQLLFDGGSKGKVLEQAYEQFNIQRPADFTGHSLSVSDIVAIKRGSEVSYHYCDSIGFKELEHFKSENPLKNAEMSMEDDYGMLDGIINNGSKQAEPEKKPSILEKLRQPLPEKPPKPTAPNKRAEMEI